MRAPKPAGAGFGWGGQEKAGADENMSDVTELGALPRVFRGYAPDAVDELVRSATAACEQARREIQGLREQARSLGEDLDEVQQPERELREAFVTAQREADELRARAAREVAAIRDEVRGRAQERMAWLEGESARIHSEIERMRGVEHEFHEGIRMILLEALRRLEERGEPPAGNSQDEPAARSAPAPAVAVAAPPEARTIVTPPPAPPEPPPAPPEPPEPPPAPSLEDDTIDIPAVPAPPVPAPPERTGGAAEIEARPLAARSILYSIAILVAAAGIAVAIWQLRAGTPEPSGSVTTQIVTTPDATVETAAGGTTGQQADGATETAASAATTESEPPAAASSERVAVPAASVVLRLRAADGDSWLSVRAGSASGKLLFEGFLFRGESRLFQAKQVWMRVGNGGNLAARLNGEPLKGLPAGTGDVLVTAGGARTVTLG